MNLVLIESLAANLPRRAHIVYRFPYCSCMRTCSANPFHGYMLIYIFFEVMELLFVYMLLRKRSRLSCCFHSQINSKRRHAVSCDAVESVLGLSYRCYIGRKLIYCEHSREVWQERVRSATSERRHYDAKMVGGPGDVMIEVKIRKGLLYSFYFLMKQFNVCNRERMRWVTIKHD